MIHSSLQRISPNVIVIEWPVYTVQYFCNIIAEGFFFILSFFVGYILSFGLFRCAHWAQVFTLARGGCENHRYHNIKPRIGNKTGDFNDIMPGSDGLGLLCILKKAVRWELNVELRRGQLGFESGQGQSSCLLRDTRAFVGSVSWELALDEQSAL